ncbi:hypothetical protein [Sutcliffiella deserti]|uniref:hypothetical protein n=1 Tax=Sutcliffiella deserti TaxID=2875501 RepID=UPI001CBD6B22|nr:hypothetical protein [Sutcliffiella deserti]
MKKWTSLVLALALSIGVLAGCAAENNNSNETEADTSNETNEDTQNQQNVSALVGMQMDMITTIRKDLAPVTSYESTGDEELQVEAVEASNKISNELRGIEIPSELEEELQEDMKESVELLALYFEERAATLQPDADLTAKDETFAAFHEQIGATFEKAGLHAPNFEKDVQ